MSRTTTAAAASEQGPLGDVIEDRFGAALSLRGQPAPPRRWRDLRTREYITYRRHLLDAHLEWAKPLMQGVVIDLGGKRDRKRGRFRPPTEGVRDWVYLNLDRHSMPDLVADVCDVPLRDACADCMICTEVLEHLANPQRCIDAAHRVLRTGGVLIGSMPFLFPVHPDPMDYQRCTPDGLRRLLRDFSYVDVRPMGGYAGALGLLLELGVERMSAGSFWTRVARRLVSVAGGVLVWLDLKQDRGTPAAPSSGAFSNGFFFVAVR